MKILRLGNSLDDSSRVPPEFALEKLIREGLEAELGERVEMVTKRAWPTERLPELLRGWVEAEKPDVVVLLVTGYWFMYQSVPLKLKRRLGRTGVLLGDAGVAMADTRWLAYNPLFRAGRKVAVRLIGGETPFTPDEVVERMTACIREVIRQEGVVLHVDGPGGRARHGGHSRRSLERMEERRKEVTRRMAEVCARYRVSFRAHDVPQWQTGEELGRSGDGLHFDGAANVVEAGRWVADIAGAVRAARGTGEEGAAGR